jgi:hypothetical protein
MFVIGFALLLDLQAFELFFFEVVCSLAFR